MPELRETGGFAGASTAAETGLAVGAALSMGNRIVAVASEPHPLPAWDLAVMAEASDIPAGVLNILTGPHAELAPHLAGHMDVGAVWAFGDAALAETVERAAAHDLKRTWTETHARDWHAPPGRDWLDHATEVKTVWIPYGEG